MNRILIVGISGTGKSTLAREIAARTALPLHHMDTLIWQAGGIGTPETTVRHALAHIAENDSWIVEGWIDRYSREVLLRADLILYLDYPGWRAAWGGLQRWWKHRGGRRAEMPEGCGEHLDLRFLWIMFQKKERPHIEATLSALPDRSVTRARTRRQARIILQNRHLLAG